MPPKKKQSLALSRRKIAEELVNVNIRRTERIQRLYADAGRSSELELKDWHGCMNVFSIFITLLCMILLYWYMLYLKSTVTVNVNIK
jgi:hypothetical protein